MAKRYEIVAYGKGKRWECLTWADEYSLEGVKNKLKSDGYDDIRAREIDIKEEQNGQ